MREFQSLQLTNSQKQALSTVLAAKNPQLALSNMTGDDNLMTAAKILSKVGLIDLSGNQATVTDKGITVMKDYDLADDSGQITSTGQQLAKTPDTDVDQATAPTDDSSMGGLGGFGGGSMGGMGGMGGDLGGLDGMPGDELGIDQPGPVDDQGGAMDGVDGEDDQQPETMSAKSSAPNQKVQGSFESYKPFSLLKELI